jgi:hypothetical protein
MVELRAVQEGSRSTVADAARRRVLARPAEGSWRRCASGTAPAIRAVCGRPHHDRHRVVPDSRRHHGGAGRRLGAFTLGRASSSTRRIWLGTGLLAFGSRASYPAAAAGARRVVDPLSDDLRDAFANEFVGVRSYSRSEDQMGENLTRPRIISASSAWSS